MASLVHLGFAVYLLLSLTKKCHGIFGQATRLFVGILYKYHII